MQRIIGWVLCLAAAASAQAPGKCTIEGRVINALTGAPLKKTIVWVEPFSPSRDASHVSAASTVTDAQGWFQIEEIEPGTYFLNARRTGYLDQGFGGAGPEVVGTPVKLAAGQRTQDVIIRLTPQSLLYGKVVDEDGEGLANAEVTVWRMSYADGRKHLETFTAGNTQADGSVVIGHIPPGRWYVSATVRGIDEGTRDVYAPTFYPGTTDSSAAAPVDVSAGADVQGLNIRLRKARTFRIRGHAPPHTVLQLLRRDRSVLEETTAAVNADLNGRFEFQNVAPGRYAIAAEQDTAFFAIAASATDAAVAPPAVRPSAVEITDSDLDDVELPVGEPAAILGSIIGGRQGEQPLIELVPAGPRREPANIAQVDAKGGFRFVRALPTVYRIRVRRLSDGFYVKSVRFAGHDITNQDLDLTSGAGGALEITLAADGGEIAGTARGADGKAMPGALVQVWPAGGENARSLRADENGRFRFLGLPPADYRVIAWEALDDDLAEYPPFRARFEAQAAEVKVAEQGHENVDVTAVARAATAAEAAKLR